MIKENKSGLSKDAHTISERFIKANDGHHELYIQEWGSKSGVPVLFIHGGPGSGCKDKHKSVFDPKKHRVILVDQRGAGNSKPYGSIKENSTQKLIEDFEQIRNALGIKKWHLHGTSWGSTLSLIYAIKNPDALKSLIIGGIWLCTDEEIDWLVKGGWQMFYPDAWERFNKLNKSKSKMDFYAYSSAFIQYYRLDDRYYPLDKEKYDTTPLEIEFDYFQNKMFLPKDYILKNVKKIKLPVRIVQGRYDFVTPPKFAYKLHKELKNSTLHWTTAGHSASDRANFDVIKALLSQLS